MSQSVSRESIIGIENESIEDDRRYVTKELGVFFFRLYVFLIPDQEETIRFPV